MTQVTRILVVDDHPLVRDGLRACLDDEPDMHLCWEAASLAEAKTKLQHYTPDLAMVDLSLGDGSGFELIEHIRAECPHVRILVISAHDENLCARKALQMGASGYLDKFHCGEEIVTAVHEIMAGRLYLSRAMTQNLMRAALEIGNDPNHKNIHALTRTETDVFVRLGIGTAVEVIADNLGISSTAIASHLETIRTKLNIESGAELQRAALQWTLEHC